MSIEKMSDVSRTIIESNPFTQISNSVILGIKDNDAFRLYCWLASKTREWKVIKEYAAKECGIAERKARECWSYFARSGLIQYVQKIGENGKFIGTDMIVTLGLNFNEKEPFLAPKKLSTEKRITGGAETARAVTARAVNAPLLNKEIQNKDLRKKEKSFYASRPPKPKSKAGQKIDWSTENIKRQDWATNNHVTAPRYRDFTQERLDREEAAERARQQ